MPHMQDYSNLTPKITTLLPKKVIGKRHKMTFANNRTFELFRSFMPERKAINNPVTNDIFCIQLYKDFHGFDDLQPNMEFEKWAAIEVSDFSNIPDGMEAYTIEGGLYAVFHYVGSSTDIRIFEYIFKTWLPGSGYELDEREHFEILGEKYKNNDLASEEEIWVPVKLKLS